MVTRLLEGAEVLAEFEAVPYADIRSRFPESVRLLIDRLLGSKFINGNARIYPVYGKQTAKDSTSPSQVEVITLIPPENTEPDAPEGQCTLYVHQLTRTGATGYGAHFGPEEECDRWVQQAVTAGVYKAL